MDNDKEENRGERHEKTGKKKCDFFNHVELQQQLPLVSFYKTHTILLKCSNKGRCDCRAQGRREKRQNFGHKS
jgi:hypothetical protein